MIDIPVPKYPPKEPERDLRAEAALDGLILRMLNRDLFRKVYRHYPGPTVRSRKLGRWVTKILLRELGERDGGVCECVTGCDDRAVTFILVSGVWLRDLKRAPMIIRTVVLAMSHDFEIPPKVGPRAFASP